MEAMLGNEDTFVFIVNGVLLPIVAIFGIMGNLSSIVVYSRQQFQKPFHILMISLAMFDLNYIVYEILIETIPLFSESYYQSFYLCVHHWLNPIGSISLIGSIYLTMAATVERYIAVCHPLYR